jgi:hypothetical protein
MSHKLPPHMFKPVLQHNTKLSKYAEELVASKAGRIYAHAFKMPSDKRFENAFLETKAKIVLLRNCLYKLNDPSRDLFIFPSEIYRAIDAQFNGTLKKNLNLFLYESEIPISFSFGQTPEGKKKYAESDVLPSSILIKFSHFMDSCNSFVVMGKGGAVEIAAQSMERILASLNMSKKVSINDEFVFQCPR